MGSGYAVPVSIDRIASTENVGQHFTQDVPLFKEASSHVERSPSLLKKHREVIQREAASDRSQKSARSMSVINSVKASFREVSRRLDESHHHSLIGNSTIRFTESGIRVFRGQDVDIFITKSDIDLINSSWNIILDPYCEQVVEVNMQTNHEKFMEVFTQALNELCPKAEKIFQNNDMMCECNLVNEMILNCQYCLEEAYVGQLIATAKSHTEGGVTIEYFKAMKTALLLALAECLGEKFTDNTQNAWSRVYSYVMMIITPSIEEVEQKKIQRLQSAIISSETFSVMEPSSTESQKWN